MSKFDGCQIPCLPHVAEGKADLEPLPVFRRLKRQFARPWNYIVKKRLQQVERYMRKFSLHPDRQGTALPAQTISMTNQLNVGDWVRVRSKEEIEGTLDRWKELKGCAFLEFMWQYCGTTQRVLQVMERFLDERDYKVKKVKGLVLLEGVICRGTPVFGRCDRCCHLFWREEWLEKLDPL